MEISPSGSLLAAVSVPFNTATPVITPPAGTGVQINEFIHTVRGGTVLITFTAGAMSFTLSVSQLQSARFTSAIQLPVDAPVSIQTTGAGGSASSILDSLISYTLWKPD